MLYKYDLLVCHASEDKDAIARQLAQALRNVGLRVWFDEYSITLGDSIQEKVVDALRECEFGVVVLSPAFFTKAWALEELNTLLTLEKSDGRKRLLPFRHNMSPEDVLKAHPVIGGRLSGSTSDGLDKMVFSVMAKFDFSKKKINAERYYCDDGRSPFYFLTNPLDDAYRVFRTDE